jgi:hypothetical protein
MAPRGGRPIDDVGAFGRSESGYGSGTLGDPDEEFYQPPYRTYADASGRTYRVPNPLYTGGGGGGVPAAGGDTASTGTGTATAAGTAAGGASRYLQLAGQLAPLLAGMAGGRQQDRVNSALLNQSQARAQADIFNTRMNAALRGPRMAAQDAAFGDTMANVQPFSFTGGTHQVGNIPVPDSTGGLSPANFGSATRQAGQSLATQGASRVTDPAFTLPSPPTLPDLPQGNAYDSILGSGAQIAALLAILGPYLTASGRNTTGTLPRTTLGDEEMNGIG